MSLFFLLQQRGHWWTLWWVNPSPQIKTALLSIISYLALSPSQEHHRLKCYLAFSQPQNSTMLDVVTCSVIKPLQAVWLRCHTDAASTKHPQPCPSGLTHKLCRLVFFFVSLRWRVFLPAPLRIWECSRRLRRSEYVHTEGDGQDKEGMSLKSPRLPSFQIITLKLSYVKYSLN